MVTHWPLVSATSEVCWVNVLCCVYKYLVCNDKDGCSAVAASKCCTLLQLVGGCRPVMHPPLAHTNPELTSVCFNGIALSIIQYTIKMLLEDIAMLHLNMLLTDSTRNIL